MKLRENIEEFTDTLDAAYESYYDKGQMPDMAAIILGNLSQSSLNENYRNMYDIMEQASHLDGFLMEGGAPVGEPKIVKERKGKGVSITIGDKEYRYVSPDISTDDLFKSAYGMWKHGGGFKVVNYLKTHALCYFGAKSPDPYGTKLVGA